MGLSIAAITLLMLRPFATQQEPKHIHPKLDDSISIVRKLVLNEETFYKVDGTLKQVITLPNGMTQEMTTEVGADLSLKSGSELEGDKLPFTLIVSKFKLISTPPQPGDSKSRTVTLKGLVDKANDMTVIGMQGIQRNDHAIAGLVARMAQGIGTYPEEPMKPGDTWTVTEQQSFMGAKKLEYEVIFEGAKTVGELTLYHLTTDTKVPVEVGMGAMDDSDPTGKGRMAMKGTVHIVADAFIDQFGLVNSLTFRTEAEVTFDSPDASGQIKVYSDEQLKIVRQPKPSRT